jgi:ribonuclease R
MKRYEGKPFEGYISGINPMGFFVELVEYPVEGLVRVNHLDGFWDLDQNKLIWKARGSGATFSMGDAVKVLISRVDVLASQMDLRLARESRPRASKKRKVLSRRGKKSRGKRKGRRVL